MRKIFGKQYIFAIILKKIALLEKITTFAPATVPRRGIKWERREIRRQFPLL